MACGNSCNQQPVSQPTTTTNCGCGCGCGHNYVCIIVLYILLAIILGSCFF